MDCAPEREADDWLLDFLLTTVTVSIPSPLSPTASCNRRSPRGTAVAGSAAGRAVALVCPSPLLLLPEAVSGQADGGANVTSEPDILFAVGHSRSQRIRLITYFRY